MKREKIKEYLEILDKTEISYYRELEIAIILFLRSDFESFDAISDLKINKIFELIDCSSSLLDIDKEEVDYILDCEDCELVEEGEENE